jgi:hypothetical protein
VTDVERVRIDLRLEGDLAAMAVSVDLHASYPMSGDEADLNDAPLGRFRSRLIPRTVLDWRREPDALVYLL